ncbi:MAG: hypothetical protein KGZ54_08890 [Dethiobacter sp.]|jgi:hypothetical protein|nr:hypothetical protein [Dethiobacter sp.]MBS3989990.1 hypothetical protein [Dethiobacter sp.]
MDQRKAKMKIYAGAVLGLINFAGTLYILLSSFQVLSLSQKIALSIALPVRFTGSYSYFFLLLTLLGPILCIIGAAQWSQSRSFYFLVMGAAMILLGPMPLSIVASLLILAVAFRHRYQTTA